MKPFLHIKCYGIMEKIYKIWCGIIGVMGFHDCAVIRFMESRGFTFILGFYSVMYDRISLKPQNTTV